MITAKKEANRADLLGTIQNLLTIGLFSFGGGFAMLPLIRQEVAIQHG